MKAHVRFEMGWSSSPRVKKAWVTCGDSAPLMWNLAVEYCNAHKTDGRISYAALIDCTRHPEPRAVIKALVDADALIDLGGDEFEVRGFLDHNQSRAQREALETVRRANGARGGKQNKGRAHRSSKQTRSKLLPHVEATSEQGASPPPKPAITTATTTATNTDRSGGGSGEPPGVGLTEAIRRGLAARPILAPIATVEWAAALAGAVAASKPISADDVEEALTWAAGKLAVDAVPGGGVSALSDQAIADRVRSGLVGAVTKRKSARAAQSRHSANAPPVQSGEGRVWTSNPREV
ncbi:MAG: hypothetical protein HOW73_20410 [Polyangiaceae bacterium]|nr:hypothetical protein [Polyangiaceae bacterium]